ncbi:uncharacterized protein N7506_012225 [Penicillium brevicompactum]|uniref:uncharacterized protein n=1 Tax=Penicillium brevicompactum TaxID=5074 RepID=UPI0025413799|nr:uncharacterized protein N7506_012225 [Penicillium brevicompactum]KAJ5319521.1 hypothetical protein N7506_012225 [Penicillium brevicompactum]
MGQSSSTQRDLPNTRYPTHSATPIERGSNPRDEDMNHRQTVDHSGEDGHPAGGMGAHGDGQGTTSDQPNERSDSWRQYIRSSRPMRSIDEDREEYEMPSREMRNAAFARMTARRQSTMSRLGSRLLPNSVIRGLLNSQEETPAEGHAHRHGGVNRPIPRTEIAHTTGRFSPFGSRVTVLRPLTGEPVGLSDGPTPTYRDPADQLPIPEPTRASWRRSVRLNRMRHSISSPISHIFGQPHTGLHSDDNATAPDLPFDERTMDTRMDYTAPPHELDSVEPAVHSRDSLPSLGPGPPSPTLMRRLPGIIRARSSRVLRREEQTPLSRVLQLAAAAIAAQLSGTPGPALPNIQALGNDGIDGSLENFIQSLQHVTSGQGQPAANGEGSGDDTTEAPSQPVNFLRVFRFANSDTPPDSDTPGQNPQGAQGTQGAHNHTTSNDPMDVDEPGESEGRTVTLVVVGVRSVPAGGGGNGEQPAGPAPGLDALLGLPFLPPSGLPVNRLHRPQPPPGDTASVSHIPRRPEQAGPRPPGGLRVAANTPSEFLRPSAPPASRRMSEPHFPQFESPPGPHPPPSTPAEHAVSTGSSGTSTPSHRPSSASAAGPDLPGHTMQPTVESTREPPAFNPAHQRRRSDSEFARHRALGSGSVRRNGMVEPDQPPPSGGRSWLIYVVGTNLSENHPALTTPSLFTDNPTYEDMILLSSLLGPAKPPVASQTDINSAGGLFRLVEYGGSLVAEATEGIGALQIQDGERCLICLSDYEVAEEVRELGKCKHVFHKECIDQWLTTGRNSCPLCRGEGVHETPAASAPGAPGAAVPTPDPGPAVV